MKKLLFLFLLLPTLLFAQDLNYLKGENINIDAQNKIDICSGTSDIKLSTGCTGGGTQYSIVFDATDGSFDLPGAIGLNLTDGSVLFANPDGEIAEDNVGMSYNRSSNTLTVDNLSIDGGTIDGGFSDGAVVFSNSSGELSQDVSGLSYNSSENSFSADYLKVKVSSAVSAAGSTISDATDLSCAFCRVSTVGSGEGVQLPALSNRVTVAVQNAGANDLELYPDSESNAINAASAGASITLSATTDDIAICTKVATALWACGVLPSPST